MKALSLVVVVVFFCIGCKSDKEIDTFRNSIEIDKIKEYVLLKEEELNKEYYNTEYQILKHLLFGDTLNYRILEKK